MYIEKNTLDDVMNELIKEIENNGNKIVSTKGDNKEILGVFIKLINPRDRLSHSLSRNIFVSPLGELLWYLKGSDLLNEIICYIPKYKDFSNDDIKLNGAYGKRLFSKDQYNDKSQIETVIELLRKKKDTRQAVIQIFDKSDLLIENNLDVPCTNTLQFIHRDGKLHLFVSMRSNDLFIGFPHDVFCFTMIQEMIAHELNLDLGYYYHNVTSMHLYNKDNKEIKKYLKEGFQSTKKPMPEMPKRLMFNDLKCKLLKYESYILNNNLNDINIINDLDSYWKDLLIILMIFRSKKSEEKLRLYEDLKLEYFKEYVKYKYINN